MQNSFIASKNTCGTTYSPELRKRKQICNILRFEHECICLLCTIKVHDHIKLRTITYTFSLHKGVAKFDYCYIKIEFCYHKRMTFFICKNQFYECNSLFVSYSIIVIYHISKSLQIITSTSVVLGTAQIPSMSNAVNEMTNVQ